MFLCLAIHEYALCLIAHGGDEQFPSLVTFNREAATMVGSRHHMMRAVDNSCHRNTVSRMGIYNNACYLLCTCARYYHQQQGERYKQSFLYHQILEECDSYYVEAEESLQRKDILSLFSICLKGVFVSGGVEKRVELW